MAVMTRGAPLPSAAVFHMSITTSGRRGASSGKRRVSSSSGFMGWSTGWSGGWSVVSGVVAGVVDGVAAAVSAAFLRSASAASALAFFSSASCNSFTYLAWAASTVSLWNGRPSSMRCFSRMSRLAVFQTSLLRVHISGTNCKYRIYDISKYTYSNILTSREISLGLNVISIVAYSGVIGWVWWLLGKCDPKGVD